MDLDNLKRAREIQDELDALNKASDLISEGPAAVTIFQGNGEKPDFVVLSTKGFYRILRDCIDEYIDALLEEAKTL